MLQLLSLLSLFAIVFGNTVYYNTTVDFSSTGTYFAAVQKPGRLFFKHSYTGTWRVPSTPTESDWSYVYAASTTIYATLPNVGVYKINALYNTWELALNSTQDWSCVTASNNAKYVLATISTDTTNPIYYSKNYGVDWDIATLSDSASISFQEVVCTYSCQIAIAVPTNNGKLYKSTNYGVAWSPLTAIGDNTWSRAIIDFKGVASYVTAGNALYTSTDVFQTITLAKTFNEQITSVKCDATCFNVLVTTYGGAYWTNSTITDYLKTLSVPLSSGAVSIGGSILTVADLEGTLYYSVDYAKTWVNTLDNFPSLPF